MFKIAVFTLSLLSLSAQAEPTFTAAPKISVDQAVFSSKGDYRELKEISLLLFEKYPVDRYLYVGVGRSPAPLIAFIQASVGDQAAINLPLSYMRAISGQKNYDQIQAALIPHFKNFLPSEKELDGRAILLIDFTLTGRSLVESVKQVRNFYESTDVTVEGFGLAFNKAPNPTTALLESEGIAYKVLEKRLAIRIFERSYSEYSEYGRYDAIAAAGGTNYWPPSRDSEKFIKLKNAFYRRQISDGNLRKRLQKIRTNTVRPPQKERSWLLQRCFELLVG